MTKSRTKTKESNPQTDLLIDLINAFTLLKNTTDAANFIQDLLTLNEIKNISRRLRIAKLLLQGATYPEIIRELHCSEVTIARVKVWLDLKGKGLKDILKKLPDHTKENKLRKTILTYYGYDPVTTFLNIYQNHLSKSDKKKALAMIKNLKTKNHLWKRAARKIS